MLRLLRTRGRGGLLGRGVGLGSSCSPSFDDVFDKVCLLEGVVVVVVVVLGGGEAGYLSS